MGPFAMVSSDFFSFKFLFMGADGAITHHCAGHMFSTPNRIRFMGVVHNSKGAGGDALSASNSCELFNLEPTCASSWIESARLGA